MVLLEALEDVKPFLKAGRTPITYLRLVFVDEYLKTDRKEAGKAAVLAQRVAENPKQRAPLLLHSLERYERLALDRFDKAPTERMKSAYDRMLRFGLLRGLMRDLKKWQEANELVKVKDQASIERFRACVVWDLPDIDALAGKVWAERALSKAAWLWFHTQAAGVLAESDRGEVVLAAVLREVDFVAGAPYLRALARKLRLRKGRVWGWLSQAVLRFALDAVRAERRDTELFRAFVETLREYRALFDRWVSGLEPKEYSDHVIEQFKLRKRISDTLKPVGLGEPGIEDRLEKARMVFKGYTEHLLTQKSEQAFVKLKDFLLGVHRPENRKILAGFFNQHSKHEVTAEHFEGIYVIERFRAVLPDGSSELVGFEGQAPEGAKLEELDEKTRWDLLIKRRHDMEVKHGLGIYPVTFLVDRSLPVIDLLMEDYPNGVNFGAGFFRGEAPPLSLFADVGGLRFYYIDAHTAHEDLHGRFDTHAEKFYLGEDFIDEFNSFISNLLEFKSEPELIEQSLTTYYIKHYKADESLKSRVRLGWRAVLHLREWCLPSVLSQILHDLPAIAKKVYYNRAEEYDIMAFETLAALVGDKTPLKDYPLLSDEEHERMVIQDVKTLFFSGMMDVYQLNRHLLERFGFRSLAEGDLTHEGLVEFYEKVVSLARESPKGADIKFFSDIVGNLLAAQQQGQLHLLLQQAKTFRQMRLIVHEARNHLIERFHVAAHAFVDAIDSRLDQMVKRAPALGPLREGLKGKDIRFMTVDMYKRAKEGSDHWGDFLRKPAELFDALTSEGVRERALSLAIEAYLLCYLRESLLGALSEPDALLKNLDHVREGLLDTWDELGRLSKAALESVERELGDILNDLEVLNV